MNELLQPAVADLQAGLPLVESDGNKQLAVTGNRRGPTLDFHLKRPANPPEPAGPGRRILARTQSKIHSAPSGRSAQRKRPHQ